MRISGTEPSAKINPLNYNFNQILTRTILMLSKRYGSFEVDRRTWSYMCLKQYESTEFYRMT